MFSGVNFQFSSSMLLSTVFFVLLSLYLSLASVGHRFFLHQVYVSRLLKIFEYGNKKIEKINQKIQLNRQKTRRLSLIQEGVVKPDDGIDTDSETDSAFFEDFECNDGELVL